MSTSKILKHVLALTRAQAVSMPRGSRPLSVALQPAPTGGARLVLWTVGPGHGPTTRRRVVMMQTGHDISSEIIELCDHVASVQWVVTRRGEDGGMQQQAQVEHVWMEREVVPLN